MTVSPQRIICVTGARPNCTQVKPVMGALDERGAGVVLVHTGLHPDPAMADVFFADLQIRKPEYLLGAGPGSHASQACRLMTAFEPLIEQVRPDVVGDVNSTMACALVTAKSGALLAHVEADLRSRDWSMPEEVNRVVTDRLGNYLFASSPDAVANLRAEGYRDDKIYLAVRVIPPARYLDFIALQASTRLVLTDSGGVQEESTVLGVPCLTLRANTERPITLAEGKNHLVGREPDRIVAAARQVLASPPAHRCPVLWAGHAGERIAAALLSANVKERLRQTAIPCGPTLIPAAPVLGT